MWTLKNFNHTFQKQNNFNYLCKWHGSASISSKDIPYKGFLQSPKYIVKVANWAWDRFQTPAGRTTRQMAKLAPNGRACLNNSTHLTGEMHFWKHFQIHQRIKQGKTKDKGFLSYTCAKFILSTIIIVENTG